MSGEYYIKLNYFLDLMECIQDANEDYTINKAIDEAIDVAYDIAERIENG